nr:hypothetical protein HK105_008272 [Polyrhizophydium stewartii]
MKVTCACLNVSVETELESLAQLDQASLDPPGHCVPLRSVLPLSIEHPPLSDVALGPDGWARITCLGCGLAVVAFHPSDPSAPPRMWLNPLPAADNSAIVAPAALHGDAIEAAKKSPGYSPAFRIVLDPSRPAPAGSPTISAAALAAVAVDDPAVPDSGSAPVHAPHEADLDAMAAKYMAVKRAEAEERIAAFRDSVNAELAEIQQRMASDRELLLSQYAAALQRAGVSESASVPEAAEASSQADPADPAAAVAAASGSHLSPSKPFLQASHARRSRSPPRPTPVPGADAATVFTAEVLSVSRPASSALSERLSRSSTPRASDASKDAAGGTLRNGTVLDPTAPAGTEHAAAAPSTSVAGSVRQVHFADDSAGPAVRLSRTDVAGPALQPDSHVAESGHGDGDGDDDDELFDMDDMSKRRVTKYALAAETKEDTSDQGVLLRAGV